MKFKITMSGLDAWYNNPFLSGKNNIRPLIDSEMERAASTAMQMIKWGYESSKDKPNSYMTTVVDRAVRIASGNPLYKTQQLAESVEYIKTGDMRYEVRIRPDAMSSHGGKQTALQDIAVFQENGFTVTVDEKMHRFFRFVAAISKEKSFFPPAIGRLLEVPARPVWGPVIEELNEKMSNYLYESVKNALYMTGQVPKGPHRGVPFKRKYSVGKKFSV